MLGYLEEGLDPGTVGAAFVCGDLEGAAMSAQELESEFDLDEMDLEGMDLEGMDLDGMDLAEMEMAMEMAMDDLPQIGIISDEACVADVAYSYDVEFARNTRIAFFYIRLDLENPENSDIIFSSELDEDGDFAEYELLDRDLVNALEYDFEQAQPQPQLPDTGLSDNHLGVGTAAMALVVAGGWVRRRVARR